jgi:hypothetical protein
MTTGCIRHPKHEPMVIYRKWQLKACNGDLASAIMLSFFEYWHNTKLDNQPQARKYNQIAKKHGEDGGQLETLIQWHTNEDIEKHTGLKRHSINKAIAFLVELGFISTCKNPNPRFSFDTTKHFIFNAEIVSRWVEDYIQNTNEALSSAEICNRDAEFDRSSAEICNGPVEICNGPVEICKHPKIPIQDFSINNTQEKGGNQKKAFVCDSDSEKPEPDRVPDIPESPKPKDPEPTEKNPPLLVKTEIKPENQKSENRKDPEPSEKSTVESGNKKSPLPPFSLPLHKEKNQANQSPSGEDNRFNKNIPFADDPCNSSYKNDLRYFRPEFSDAIAEGTIDTMTKIYGKTLLCMLNQKGLDAIAVLPEFLDYYFKQNLNGLGPYKDHSFAPKTIQSKTAESIAGKIRDNVTGVLVQTIADFKKKLEPPAPSKLKTDLPEPRALNRPEGLQTIKSIQERSHREIADIDTTTPEGKVLAMLGDLIA